MRTNDYEGAVDAFTEAIALNPTFPNSYRYRAQALKELGRADDARADEEKMASLLGSARQDPDQDRIRRRVQRRNDIEQRDATRRRATPAYSSNNTGGNTMEDFLTFRRMITPTLIQIAFWLAIVATVIFGLAGLAFGDGLGKLGGLAILIFGPLYARVIAELFILVFRMNETLTDIKNNTDRRD
ncbi:MAG: DUF4282 domain-containing protein [Chloroflexi bacterium]|nr:DUF4282 domain-containing protein [Chloroflexota bacterium]